MKKNLYLTLSLLSTSLFFLGCQKDENNLKNKTEELIVNTSITTGTEYTGQYLSLYPFGVEVNEEPDFSWMTVQKLYNDPSLVNNLSLKDRNNPGRKYYFLNIEYQVKTGDTYENKFYQILPQESPIYYNDFSEENSNLIKIDGNVLLTGYLESKIETELFIRETEEELNTAPKVENWYLRYFDKKGEEKILNLGYIRKDIFTVWDEGERDALIALYYSPRIDHISHFMDYKNESDIDLRTIVNDGNIHTFHIIISKPPYEGNSIYSISTIKERYFVE